MQNAYKHILAYNMSAVCVSRSFATYKMDIPTIPWSQSIGMPTLHKGNSQKRMVGPQNRNIPTSTGNLLLPCA